MLGIIRRWKMRKMIKDVLASIRSLPGPMDVPGPITTVDFNGDVTIRCPEPGCSYMQWAVVWASSGLDYSHAHLCPINGQQHYRSGTYAVQL